MDAPSSIVPEASSRPAEASHDATVRLLGPFALRNGLANNPLQPRLRGMLAGLALHAGRAVTIEKLTRWLWDDDLPDNPGATIHTYVSRLRRGVTRALPIHTLKGAYSWEIPRELVDALRFEDLVANADRVAGTDTERHLCTALALWQGPALCDIPATNAVVAERSRLRELRLFAVERRNVLLIRRGQATELIGDLRKLVVEFPFREGFIHQLMVCLDQASRRADALHEYQDAYRRFCEHLGVPPGPDLQRLHLTLLREDSACQIDHSFPVPGTPGHFRPSNPAAGTAGPATVPNRVQFRLLGPMEATVGGEPVRLSPLQRSLLAFMLLNPNRAMPARELAGALWGEALPAAYGARIRTLVSGLRKALAAASLIATDRPGYLLRIERDQLDLGLFLDHLEQANQAAKAGRLDVSLTHYDEALALWQGPALTSVRGSFVMIEAARLQQLRLTALKHRLHLRGLTGAATAGRPSACPPGSLPAAPSGFVGRDVEMAELDVLRSGPDRLLLVVGAAGVGKTALAIQCAHRWADEFPDGQLFLDMRGFDHGPQTSAAQALPRLLYDLGLPVNDIPVDFERQIVRYRSLTAGRRLLIVLDNVADAEQVRPLLPGNPSCLVLATSRDRLGGLVALDGARRLTLDVLPAPVAIDVLKQAGTARLDAEPDAVTDLARLCGYLPLALRIASARLSDRAYDSVRQHVDELVRHGRMDRLQMVGDQRATVRGTFDLSYRALPEPVRRMFRLLSLVPSPAGLGIAAAAALAATPMSAADHMLDSLARVHLLRYCAADRFSCHDLLNEYALELSGNEDPPMEREAGLRRLFDYYLAATDRAAELMLSPTVLLHRPPRAPGVAAAAFSDAAEATAWISAEWGNLVAAVEYAATRGPLDAAWHLADALRGIMYLRGSTSEWLAVTEHGLTAARRGGDVLAEAAMRFCLGLARWRMADYQASLEEYELALQLYRQARWPQGEASALRSLAVTLITMGQPQLAIAKLHESLKLDLAIGHRHGEAASLNNLAAVHQELGDLTQAADFHERTLPLLYENGQRHSAAIALENLGIIRHDQGRLDEALDLLNRSLVIGQESGSRHQEAAALLEIGAVHCDAGRYREAMAALDDALTVAAALGDGRLRVIADTRLAVVHLRAGQVTDAIVRLDAAQDLAERVGHYRSYVDVRLALAEACCERGEYRTGYAHAEQAFDAAERAGSPIAVADARQARSLAVLGLGHIDQCLDDARQSLRTNRRAGRRLAEARVLVILGHAERRAGRADAGETRWRQAHALFEQIGAADRAAVAALLSLRES